ncbi:hypothetical protein JST97_00925 [bacterium]|nr:hypothetical protein [bacterium]
MDKGLFVLTERFLWRRGYCCGSGCRHCPYDHESVPPRTKEKLAQPVFFFGKHPGEADDEKTDDSSSSDRTSSG